MWPAPLRRKLSDAPSSVSLSERDVERLLHVPAPEARLEVLQRVSVVYRDAALPDEDRRIAERIFRVLLKDTELSVRAALAEAVKDHSLIPHDIAVALARDAEPVALPMLSASDVLNDRDLVALVRYHQRTSCHAAVARRRRVSAAVCDALIDTGKDEVVDTLLHNAGARMGEAQCGKVIEFFPFHEAVLSALARRDGLPPAIAEALVARVSATLADELCRKYRLPKPSAEQVAECVREIETLALLNRSDRMETVKLAARLHEEKRLTPSLLFAALTRGRLGFFEAGMAQLAGIPLTNARALVHDRGALGFKALYEKVALPEKFFTAVKLTRDAVIEMHESSPRTPGTREYAEALASRLIGRARGRRIEHLPYLLALARQVAG